ncbi:MAG: hypothetical protein QNJ37_07865 [Crocosphaera sp.]|nr:hypothetical protein [Crocosphaera sp.]
MTKSNTELTEAINLAQKILKHNKSAKISLARFLSRLYNASVSGFILVRRDKILN